LGIVPTLVTLKLPIFEGLYASRVKHLVKMKVARNMQTVAIVALSAKDWSALKPIHSQALGRNA
jgi:hypothetical protein